MIPTCIVTTRFVFPLNSITGLKNRDRRDFREVLAERCDEGDERQKERCLTQKTNNLGGGGALPPVVENNLCPDP